MKKKTHFLLSEVIPLLFQTSISNGDDIEPRGQKVLDSTMVYDFPNLTLFDYINWYLAYLWC